MPRRDRSYYIAGAVIGLTVLAVVVAYFAVNRNNTSSTPSSGVASDVAKTIPSTGAKLSAEVITPTGHGPAPLIVMPAAWSNPGTSYHAVGKLLAEAGYEVVAYAQRGFGGSTGKVDFAGPATQHDARAVIDWALKHTNADPKRIGMFGMSYGAGVSLLTAAHDPRVKAVVALSTWTNVAETYDQAATPHVAALHWLLGDAKRVPSFDGTTRHLRSTLLDSPHKLGQELHAISAVRSPSTYLKQLNKNGAAVMIGNAFEDSIFDPAQLIPFYNSLTTPKRLELAAGDHGTPERSSLSGLPNTTVDDAVSWLNHYVRGIQNGIDAQDPIVLTDVKTGQLHTFSSWPSPSGKTLPLGAPGTLQTSTSSQAWSSTIPTGTDSGAESASTPFASAAQFRLPTMPVAHIDKRYAFVWNGPELAAGLSIVGTPSMQFGLASSSRIATIYLYLYDVTPEGAATLIDVQPYTATGLTRTPRHVSIPMQPTAYTVPSGDHVALVVDTVDASYLSSTPAHSLVAVSSTTNHPATFTVPSST